MRSRVGAYRAGFSAKFRFSWVTPSTISRLACGHERKSSWSKRLQESPPVTFASRVALARAVLPAKQQPHLPLVLCRVRTDANEQTAVVWGRDRICGQAAEIAKERRRLAA